MASPPPEAGGDAGAPLPTGMAHQLSYSCLQRRAVYLAAKGQVFVCLHDYDIDI